MAKQGPNKHLLGEWPKGPKPRGIRSWADIARIFPAERWEIAGYRGHLLEGGEQEVIVRVRKARP